MVGQHRRVYRGGREGGSRQQVAELKEVVFTGCWVIAMTVVEGNGRRVLGPWDEESVVMA